MLATLNLQLSLSAMADAAPAPTAPSPLVSGHDTPGFTDLLRLRVDSSLLDEQLSGDFLPTSGNDLPQQSQTVRLSGQSQIVGLPEQSQIVGLAEQSQIVGLAEQSQTVQLPAPVLPELREIQVSAQALGEPEAQTLVESQAALQTEVFEAIHTTPPLMPVSMSTAGLPETSAVAASTAATTNAKPDMSGNSPTGSIALGDPSERTLSTSSNGAIIENMRNRAGADVRPPVVGDASKKPPVAPGVVPPPDAKGQWSGLPPQSADTIASLPVAYEAQRNNISPRSKPAIATTSAGDPQGGLRPARQTETVALLRSLVPAEFSGVRETSRGPRMLRVSQVSASPHATQTLPAPSAPRVTGEPSATALAQPANAPISTPVSDPAWGERISERVLTMAGSQFKTAEIRLTPAELGPLRVHVSVDDGAANVTFHAQHSVTREVIEQALPRLRDMLAENGLSLGQTSVGEHDGAPGNRDQNMKENSPRPAADGFVADRADEALPARQKVVAVNSLVDTFA